MLNLILKYYSIPRKTKSGWHIAGCDPQKRGGRGRGVQRERERERERESGEDDERLVL